MIGVVIPTLNEEARVAARLAEVLKAPDVCSVVVADGGSEDRTREIAEATAAKDTRVLFLCAPKGRARQMNAGAAALAAMKPAACRVFLFLHADVKLPQGFGAAITAALAEPAVVAGAFRTWTVPDGDEPPPRWAPLLHLADVRSRYSRVPYGDQAIFVKTAVFDRIGGFPDQPLMEDLELSLRLRKQGRLAILRQSVAVSGRRFLARPIYYTFLVNVFPALYRLGVSPATLDRLYKAVR